MGRTPGGWIGEITTLNADWGESKVPSIIKISAWGGVSVVTTSEVGKLLPDGYDWVAEVGAGEPPTSRYGSAKQSPS